MSFLASIPAHGRVPRARRDPITSAEQALCVFRLAMCHPLSPETLIMFLDSGRRGQELISVSGTAEPTDLIDVADTMAFCASANDDITGLVIATVRPGGGLLPEDDDLWIEADDIVRESGLTLVDWLVIGRSGAQSLRERLGIPPRWAA